MVRTGSAEVACGIRLVGSPLGRFGQDAADLVHGGCERDARGLFTFGFPDQHMDAGETLGYQVGFEIEEGFSLRNVEVGLRCVKVDADSPAAFPDPSTVQTPSASTTRRARR
jgi:hypothetical protein